MPMGEVIKSMLVSLGVAVNEPSFRMADERIRKLESRTKFGVANIAKGSIMVGVALGVTAIASAKLLLIMSQVNMKTVATDNALAAMGKTMDEVSKDPELLRQFKALKEEAKSFALPTNFKDAFKEIQGVQFEFTRLKQIAVYALQWIAFYLTKYVNGPLSQLRNSMKSFGDAAGKGMATWAKPIAQAISMVLRLFATLVRAGMNFFNFLSRLFNMIPKNFRLIAAGAAALGILLKSGPLGIIIAIISGILLLLDDFYTYLDGGDSLLGPVWSTLIKYQKQIGAGLKLLLSFLAAWRLSLLLAKGAQLAHNAAMVVWNGILQLSKVKQIALNVATTAWRGILLLAKGAQLALNLTMLAGQNVMKLLRSGTLAMAAAQGLAKVKTLALKGAMFAASAMAKVVTAAQWLFNAALSANPIGLVIAAIAGLIAIGVALYKNWDTVREFLGKLWAAFKETFPGAAAFIQNVIDKVKDLINWVKNGAEGVKNFFGKILGGGESEQGGGGDNPKPKHAAGGVFYKPHAANIAEDGPEAVVPLSKPKRAAAVLSQAFGAVKQANGNTDISAAIKSGFGQAFGMLNKMRDNYAAMSRPLGGGVTNNTNKNITVHNQNNNNIYGGSDPNATARAVNDTSNAMLIRSLQGVVV